jgi:CubicO group peptidase (beta-lactamase class C family)
VRDYWTGAGELNHPRKRLDAGPHRAVTFAHLRDHRAGFPVSNGHQWLQRVNVPAWAAWTGDPDADNHAHIRPGRYHYSSGGYWRLSQALTAVLGRTLKDYLDDHIFRAIGIRPERWRWVPGGEVRRTRSFYPSMPGYGLFVDPPYRIEGIDVVGGGGWVEMTPLDLARVGLLLARGGTWGSTRLIGEGRALEGHNGANDSELRVWPEHDTVFVRVTTQGLVFDPDRLLYGDENRTGERES